MWDFVREFMWHLCAGHLCAELCAGAVRAVVRLCAPHPLALGWARQQVQKVAVVVVVVLLSSSSSSSSSSLSCCSSSRRLYYYLK